MKVEDDVSKDIGDMLGEFDTPTEPEPEPEKEPEKELEKEPEKEPELEPEKEPEGEPGKEPEKEPEKEPPPDPREKVGEDKLKDMEKQNRLLIERIEKMSGPKEPPEKEPEREPGPEPEPKPLEPTDFLKDRDLSEVVDDPKTFNEVLNRVAERVLEMAVPAAVEKALTMMPKATARVVSNQLTMMEKVRDFYRENKDLVSVKRTVGAIANEVSAEHPDWDVPEIFTEAADRTRKTLGIKKEVLSKPSKESEDDPAFAKQRGSRGGGEPKRTGLEKEIDDLIQ